MVCQSKKFYLIKICTVNIILKDFNKYMHTDEKMFKDIEFGEQDNDFAVVHGALSELWSDVDETRARM